jgi:hypothetical protein
VVSALGSWPKGRWIEATLRCGHSESWASLPINFAAGLLTITASIVHIV